MPHRLKVGVIGCGAIAQVMHLPYMTEHDDKFEILALADTHRPTLDAVADHYHVAARFTNWRDLLTHPEIEAVIICHNGSHHDSVIAALNAGKHIFVEKPLAWNLREAEAVAARAAASDRIVQMAYHKRYDPAFTVARDYVDAMRDLSYGRITVLHPDNDLGLSPFRIRRGDGVISEGHHDPGSFEAAVAGQLSGFTGGSLAPLVDEALGPRKDDPRLRLGYGIIVISLIHQIYMLDGFLGMPQRVLHTDIWRQGLSIHALVEYPEDVRVSLDWHYLGHLKDYREEYLFVGAYDRVAMQLPSPYFKSFPSPVVVHGGEGELAWEKRITVSYEEAFKNELIAFYENVVHLREPATTVASAVEHIRLVQALIDAAK